MSDIVDVLADFLLRKGPMNIEPLTVRQRLAREILDAIAATPAVGGEDEPCPYCSDAKRTGLPGNACENCMNTGLKYPERAAVKDLANRLDNHAGWAYRDHNLGLEEDLIEAAAALRAQRALALAQCALTDKDLRWHISDAFCAGCWDCGCTQEQIDAAEGKCWEYADRMLAHLAKQNDSAVTSTDGCQPALISIMDNGQTVYEDDPSADERWNAGVDCAMKLFCDYLGVDPNAVTWDAATETVDGDISAVIGNILRTKYGEDWSPASPPEQPAAVKMYRDALAAANARIAELEDRLSKAAFAAPSQSQ